LAITVYIHRMFGDFPAKIAVYTPYIYIYIVRDRCIVLYEAFYSTHRSRRVGQNCIYTPYGSGQPELCGL